MCWRGGGARETDRCADLFAATALSGRSGGGNGNAHRCIDQTAAQTRRSRGRCQWIRCKEGRWGGALVVTRDGLCCSLSPLCVFRFVHSARILYDDFATMTRTRANVIVVRPVQEGPPEMQRGDAVRPMYVGPVVFFVFFFLFFCLSSSFAAVPGHSSG